MRVLELPQHHDFGERDGRFDLVEIDREQARAGHGILSFPFLSSQESRAPASRSPSGLVEIFRMLAVDRFQEFQRRVDYGEA